MRRFLICLAWFGLLIILAGLPLAYSSSYTLWSTRNLGSGAGFFLTAIIGYIGCLLALVIGFLKKPKFFWIFSILVGLVYLYSFYGFGISFRMQFLGGLIFALIPGIVCIAVGFAIKLNNK